MQDASDPLIALFNRDKGLPDCLLGMYARDLCTIRTDYGHCDTEALELCQLSSKLLVGSNGKPSEVMEPEVISYQARHSERREAFLLGIKDYAEASLLIARVLDGFQDIGSEEGVAGARSLVVTLLAWQGQYTEALTYLEEHEAEILKGNPYIRSVTQWQHGALLCKFNKPNAGDPYLLDAFTSMKRGGMCPAKPPHSLNATLRPLQECLKGSPFISERGRLRQRSEFPFSAVRWRRLTDVLKGR